MTEPRNSLSAEVLAVGSAGTASTKPSRRRGIVGSAGVARAGQRHGMDCLETWEIPLTSACEQTGSLGRRLNNDPGPEGPSDLPGAQVARHEAKRIARIPEAKQISDRGCVAGSRSTPIGPVTSGNRTHLDPIEERGVPCGENRWRETRKRTLSLTNLSTKRQRIAELARTKRGVAFSPPRLS